LSFYFFGILGIFHFPGGDSSKRSKGSENNEPPDYVIFDDLDDI